MGRSWLQRGAAGGAGAACGVQAMEAGVAAPRRAPAPERSPARAGLHVNFSDKGEVRIPPDGAVRSAPRCPSAASRDAMRGIFGPRFGSRRCRFPTLAALPVTRTTMTLNTKIVLQKSNY